MQLAVSSWSLRDHINKDFPFSQFPQYIKDTFGIGAVEVCQMHIPAPDARRLDALAAGLASAGVKIVNMPIDVGDISQADESKRNHDLKLIEVWMDAAAYLGSPAARVNSGSGDLPTAVESFRRLAEYGQKIGVKILLENHGGLSADLDNVRKLLDEMDGGFGTSPDFGNFPEQVRYEGLELMAPRAEVVHAKTYDFDSAGEFNDFDFPRCLRIFQDSGFDGPLSIEFEGKGDQPDGVRRIVELIRKSEPSIQM